MASDMAIVKYAPFLCLLHFVYLVGLKGKMAAEYDSGVDVFEPDLTTPIAGTVFYLALVTVGPRVMKGSKPVDCKEAMIAYNLYQVIYNVWCVTGLVMEVMGLGYNTSKLRWWGNKFDGIGNNFGLGFFIYLHYINKYLEFFDTIFMVLRKKTDQLSFLHVYHHLTIAWAWWTVCKVQCGGDSYFGALFNSFIHVLMYAYYLFAALKISCPWKKYLTQMQMVQFMVCNVHAVYVYVYETCPPILSIFQVFMMTSLFALFAFFYVKKYKAAASSTKKQK